ncbi:MAG: hypothetical protein EZS28_008882 [Streblomastix strix]|uniref:Uncharacterized protein n=1 Tax=Streblomastix strix TaxID=222440 RepID=A0A5J4WL92_9EUKA|nr:MAG: hypothetical protein EZS28_008882 [Streblomastix strix]
MIFCLESLKEQIQMNRSSKQVVQIPKLLQSLIALVTFRLGTHLREQTDLLRLGVRRHSRYCLREIQYIGDEYVQSELVRQGYGRAMSITFSTAGGVGEEQDEEINVGLGDIFYFLRNLHEGRNDWQRSFQLLPLLIRSTEVQIEEEGANEEIDAQMKNNGYNGEIFYYANEAKEATLNRFIHRLRI